MLSSMFFYYSIRESVGTTPVMDERNGIFIYEDTYEAAYRVATEANISDPETDEEQDEEQDEKTRDGEHQ